MFLVHMFTLPILLRWDDCDSVKEFRAFASPRSDAAAKGAAGFTVELDANAHAYFDYQDRVRCLAHLSDSRRPRCWLEFMATGPTPLSQSDLERLDAADRRLRRQAQQAGRSHHIA